MASFSPALTEAPQPNQPHWDRPDKSGPRPCLFDVSLDHALHITELYVRLYEAARTGFDVLTLSPEPSCWRTYPGPAGQQWCKPDLFVRVGVGQWEDHWFVEVDRATQSASVLERKAETYAGYWCAGVLDPFPLVLFTVPDDRRWRFVVDVVGHLPAPIQPLFRVALFDDAVQFISRGGPM